MSKWEELRKQLFMNMDKSINPMIVLGWMENIDEKEGRYNNQLGQTYYEQAEEFYGDNYPFFVVDRVV